VKNKLYGGDQVSFNYSKLLGKMRECNYTQEKLAKAVKMNKGTLNAKLKNKGNFTAPEMDSICQLLNIDSNEIGAYFFAR
jgi:DNA-binding XRE family transcriptional regulator